MRTDLYQFAVVGGDLRQWYLADILASKGHGVLAYGLCKDEKIENVKYVSSVKELIQEAEVLVYPIPFLSPNRMSGAELKERKEMLSCLRKGQIDIVNIGLHFFLKNVRPYAASCSEA